MPTNDYVRERIIRIMDSVTKPPNYGEFTRRELRNLFGHTYRKQVDDMIGQLLSEGVLFSLGTGRSGDPVKIIMNRNYPSHICPLCKQRIPSTSTI